MQLIRELENIPFEERVKEGYRGPEGISEAPYLPFLLNQREGESSPLTGTHVSRDTGISFDMAQAEDRGTYFTAPGVISCPATTYKHLFHNHSQCLYRDSSLGLQLFPLFHEIQEFDFPSPISGTGAG